jgi:D-alanyl-D-alanine dipeptidase
MNKLQNPRIILLAGLFIFSTNFSLLAQDSLKTPKVTSNMEEYINQVKTNPGKQMVELKTLIPNLVYDIRYASLNNFMHRYMYARSGYRCYLRKDAALSLKKAQDILIAKGYGFKIFDAYRPYAVTVKFWELVKDERYVANPAKGSGHNRGVAIDLTIIESATGKELDMGTGFDNFTDSAHHDFKDLPESVLKNRLLLRETMEQAGFRALETEWWHYSLPAAANYELLDLPFKKLRKRL